MTGRVRRLGPAAVALTALAVRGIYFLQVRDLPASGLLLGDAAAYDAWARRIAGGEWWGADVFYQSPLYPYLLGVVYALAGHAPWLVKLLQVAGSALAAYFLARAGTILLGPATGVVAGLLLALQPTSVFSDFLIQKTSLDILLVSSLILLLARNSRSPTPPGWLAAGAVAALLALNRENALALLPVPLAATWAAAGRQAGRRGLLPASLVLAGWLLVLLPVGLRNLAVGGEFHLTTAQSGPNFWIGNNPAADGLYRPLTAGPGNPQNERVAATRMAAAALGHAPSPGEVSAYWHGRALEWIRSEPGAWLSLLGKKALLFWNRVEASDTDDQYSYQDWSPLLALLGSLLSFGTLVPLAALGLAATLGRWRRILFLHLFLLIYPTVVILYYVFARYRFPVAPVLILFAAAGLVHLLRLLRAGLRGREHPLPGRCITRGLRGALVILPPFILLANWPAAPDLPVLSRAAMRNNVGVGLMNGGDLRESANWFLESLALAPDYVEPCRNLGLLRRREGNPQEALAWFRRGLAAQPDDVGLLVETGITLHGLGRIPEATDSFRRALALDPAHATAHLGLGRSLLGLGREEEGRHHLREAVRLDPSLARFL
jgi:tetratricopeptide (TPR) repeat protein